MRPLEESEIQQVFEKLFKFVGKNLKNIVDRADQPHCFRLHKKVRRDSVRPPRRRSAPFFLSLGGKVPSSVLLSCNPVSAMMKEITALLIPREVQTILMVEFLRLSRQQTETRRFPRFFSVTAVPRSTSSTTSWSFRGFRPSPTPRKRFLGKTRLSTARRPARANARTNVR